MKDGVAPVPGSVSLNWMRPLSGIMLGQDLAAVLERHVAQIVVIEVQQIESDEIEVVLAPGDGLA